MPAPGEIDPVPRVRRGRTANAPPARGHRRRRPLAPAADVYQTVDEYVVELELPGFDGARPPAPHETNGEHLSATYGKGLLTLRVPRPRRESSARIEIARQLDELVARSDRPPRSRRRFPALNTEWRWDGPRTGRARSRATSGRTRGTASREGLSRRRRRRDGTHARTRTEPARGRDSAGRRLAGHDARSDHGRPEVALKEAARLLQARRFRRARRR